LAVFSIAGISAAILLSLLVLPHLIPADGSEGGARGSGGSVRVRRRRGPILAGWLLLLALCGWQSTHLEFNGDLRRMSLVPDELAAAESKVRGTWGDFRGQAMVWARGADLEQALAVNERLFSLLKKELPGEPMVSIAPLLPPAEVQEANRARWRAFWQGERGARILAGLRREATALGFSDQAFAPFFEALDAPYRPVTLQGMREAGLGSLVESLLVGEGEGAEVLTLVPDRPELAALVEGQIPDGVRLVSQGRFRREVSAAIGKDFFRFILLASAVVVLLLALLFRRADKVIAAAVPVATGLLVMFGAMGALGLEFNLFNVIATILVIGLGVDYGIFMVCKVTEGLDRATGKAVLVSGLTTLAGFGALVMARHPALHSIGVTVLLGIGSAIPAALLVIPALYGGKAEADDRSGDREELVREANGL
jgi:predicted exporter